MRHRCARRCSCGSTAPRPLPRRSTRCSPALATTIGSAAPFAITAHRPAVGPASVFRPKISSARRRRISTPQLPRSRPAIMTHMKTLYPQPLSIVGDCSRSMIKAASGNELIGGDLSSIESRVTAWVAGEEWKLDSYRKYDETKDPRDEPYVQTAVKVLRLSSPDAASPRPNARSARPATWRSAIPAALGRGGSSSRTSSATQRSRSSSSEWRAAHPKIKQFW